MLSVYLEIDLFHGYFEEVEEREEVSCTHVHVEDNRLPKFLAPQIRFT